MNKKVDVSNIILVGKRITLRAFKESDLLDFYNYCKVPGVGEMAGWPHHKNINVSKFVLTEFIKDRKTLAIIFNDNQKVIGSIGIERYNETVFLELANLEGVEIGYVLAKEYWGQRIMVEAMSLVVDYLFKKERLDFLLCGHFIVNYQSRRVIEKLGFSFIKDSVYKTIDNEIKPVRKYILINKEKEI